ncbi:cobalt-zinc-cadmium resistance protein CzcD [Paenibacillus sp. JCM 10914]|nr:cobalt-zinc-cadmium resistance protein CzcD [Paenibacillus sp. JCM 10914]
MMLIAIVGLLANLISAWFLMRTGDVKDNMNMRSAYLHVIGDALGSVGAILAGIIMMLFGWYIADPIISILVAVLILRSAWRIIQNTVHILMEGAPGHMDTDSVKQSLLAIDGVKSIHDVHIWTITSSFESFTCHLVVTDTANSYTVLQQAIHKLEEEFGLSHVTIQVENESIMHKKIHV